MKAVIIIIALAALVACFCIFGVAKTLIWFFAGYIAASLVCFLIHLFLYFFTGAASRDDSAMRRIRKFRGPF